MGGDEIRTAKRCTCSDCIMSAQGFISFGVCLKFSVIKKLSFATHASLGFLPA